MVTTANKLGGSETPTRELSLQELSGRTPSEVHPQNGSPGEVATQDMSAFRRELQEGSLPKAQRFTIPLGKVAAKIREQYTEEARAAATARLTANFNMAPGVYLYGLSGRKLENGNYAGADICLMNLRKAPLAYANLTEVIMDGVTLDDAQLLGAKLIGASATSAKLDAHWQDAEVDDADFSGSILGAFFGESPNQGVVWEPGHMPILDRAKINPDNLNNAPEWMREEVLAKYDLTATEDDMYHELIPKVLV